LDYQIQKYKEVNNGVIPKAVEEKFEKLEAELKEANRKIQEYEAAKSQTESTDAANARRQDAQAQKERRKKNIQQKKGDIDAFFNSLKEQVKSDPNQLNNIFQVVGE